MQLLLFYFPISLELCNVSFLLYCSFLFFLCFLFFVLLLLNIPDFFFLSGTSSYSLSFYYFLTINFYFLIIDTSCTFLLLLFNSMLDVSTLIFTYLDLFLCTSPFLIFLKCSFTFFSSFSMLFKTECLFFSLYNRILHH